MGPGRTQNPGGSSRSRRRTSKPRHQRALIGREQHGDDQEQDRRQRDHQRDQDVRGWPQAAAVVPEQYLLGVVIVVAARGLVGLLTGCAEDVVRVGVLEVRHGPALLPSGVGWRPTGTTAAGRGRRAGIMWLHRHHPLQAEAGVGSGGLRPPRRPQRMEAAPPPTGWRPALAVAGTPPLAGIQAGAFVADLGDLNAVEAAR